MSPDAKQSHLSIGEVLSLVQQEFPDVTISKIRFLESQGLIAPERTASGFRKFYDSDIQRLRWILRQQSDHFLPLKVIKKMLDDGVDPTAVPAPSEAQQTLWSAPGEPTSGATEANGVAVQEPTKQAKASVSSGDGAGSGETVVEQPPKRRSSSHPSVVAAAMTKAAAEAAEQRQASASTGGEEPADLQGEGAARPIMTPADIVAALQEDPRPRSARRTSRSAEDAVPGVHAGESGVRSFTTDEIVGPRSDSELLSADEVCELFDIEPGMLAELERFGLLSPRRFGGVSSYDELDVAVIGMAVKYDSLGVGARHLRMYKIAAEREAGFIEQLVVPLLKQRNPTARENASERCTELASMGNELHNLILKRHLRNLFGNR